MGMSHPFKMSPCKLSPWIIILLCCNSLKFLVPTTFFCKELLWTDYFCKYDIDVIPDIFLHVVVLRFVFSNLCCSADLDGHQPLQCSVDILCLNLNIIQI